MGGLPPPVGGFWGILKFFTKQYVEKNKNFGIFINIFLKNLIFYPCSGVIRALFAFRGVISDGGSRSGGAARMARKSRSEMFRAKGSGDTLGFHKFFLPLKVKIVRNDGFENDTR
ncbi:MAG: hypothetical protein LUF83_08215 [Alistipes sp.]|nr:hypothetical protein [Alistipes sp.]